MKRTTLRGTRPQTGAARILAPWLLLGLAASTSVATLPPPGVAPGAAGWSTFLEPSAAIDIAAGSGEVWLATSGGLRAYDVQSRRWESYYRVNGLPSDAVTAVATDAAGRVWTGTSASDIARLDRDGSIVILPAALLGLPLGGITSLAVSGDSLWIGAVGGLGLVRVGANIGKVTLANLPAAARRGVHDVLVSAREVWVASDSGVVRLDIGAGMWTDISAGLPRAPILSLAEGAGAMWAATATDIYAWRDGTWSLTTTPVQLGTVRALAGDAGSIYAATSLGVFAQTTGAGNWSSLQFPTDAPVYSLVVDAIGTLWAGTQDGVARLCTLCDPPIPVWDRERAPGPLGGRVPDQSGPRIAFDSDGTVWITTQTSGVLRYDGSTWSNYGAAQGLGDNAYWFAALVDHTGGRWFGNWGSGLAHITSVADSFHYELIAPTAPGVGLSGYFVMSAAEDARGRLWFGQDTPTGVDATGVDIYDPASSRWTNIQKTTTPQLTSNQVWSIAFDERGRAWLGERRGGVDVWDMRGTDDPSDDIWTLIPEAQDRLPSANVNAVLIDGSRAWVGTIAGLARFDLNLTQEELLTATARDALYRLPSSEVRGLSLDRSGSLWVGTSGGIAVVGRDGTVDQSRLFSVANSGLVSDNIFALAWNPGRTELWIGTDRGISRYRPGETSPPVVPQVALRAMPNPFVPGGTTVKVASYAGGEHVAFSGEARARIYAADGRLVRTVDGVQDNRAFWDGTDATGRRVAPGLYIVHLDGPGVNARATIAVTP
jgi:ligand-binding sensor domain-containing protein